MNDDVRDKAMAAAQAAHDVLTRPNGFVPPVKPPHVEKLRYIYSKDGTRAIRADLTQDLFEVLWFGHLRTSEVLEVFVPSVDKDPAAAMEWVKRERKMPSPPTAPYDNPFRLK